MADNLRDGRKFFGERWPIIKDDRYRILCQMEDVGKTIANDDSVPVLFEVFDEEQCIHQEWRHVHIRFGGLNRVECSDIGDDMMGLAKSGEYSS